MKKTIILGTYLMMLGVFSTLVHADARAKLKNLGVQPAPASGPSTSAPPPAVDTAELRRLRQEISRLQRELQQLRNAAQQGQGAPEPASNTAQVYMNTYSTLNPQQRAANFEQIFTEVRQNQDINTAYRLYRFLMERFEALAMLTNPTPADLAEAQQILTHTERMANSAGAFAQAAERHLQQTQQRTIQQQIQDDRAFYNPALEEARRRENDPAHPPLLLLFLLRPPEIIVTTTRLNIDDWRALTSYLRYMTIEELRGLRYHLQQNNNRSNIGQNDKGNAIKEFLEAITNRINENRGASAPRPFTINEFQLQYVGKINALMTPDARLAQQLREDQPFYQTVLADTRNRENDPHNPPLLLLLLLKNERDIVTTNALNPTDWTRLEGYLTFLTLNELRALRYHLQKNNNRANIPSGPQGNAIKQFINAIQNAIQANNPTPIDNVAKQRFQQHEKIKIMNIG